MGLIRRFVPEKFQAPLLRMVPWMKKGVHWGWQRYCPVCHSRLRGFIRSPQQPDVRGACPVCGSLPRHRMVWVFLDHHPELFESRPCKLLHVAPEEVLERRFRARPGVEYLSIDLVSPKAMQHMDITALELDDASVDAIFCSHVLEHVQDDRQGLREFRRILRPGGWMIQMIPHSTLLEHTLEDPSIVSPQDRFRVYGWYDHVRLYGRDLVDRIREAGFEVEHLASTDLVDERQVRRMGLQRESLFMARRPKD